MEDQFNGHGTEVEIAARSAARHEAAGQWSDALLSYNEVIRTAPTHEAKMQAYMAKGRILHEVLGHTQKAADHYRAVLEIDSGYFQARTALAKLGATDDFPSDDDATDVPATIVPS